MVSASEGNSYLLTGCALAAASHLGLMGSSSSNATSLVSKKKALRQQPLIPADPVKSADVAVDEKSFKNAKMCTGDLLVKERQGSTAVLEFPKGEEYMRWRP